MPHEATRASVSRAGRPRDLANDQRVQRVRLGIAAVVAAAQEAAIAATAPVGVLVGKGTIIPTY